MSDTIGYVVIEFNQASRRPGLVQGADLYDTAWEAVGQAQDEREDTARRGRRESYAVAKVVLLDEEAR